MREHGVPGARQVLCRRLAAKFGDAESVKIVWKPNVMSPLDFEKAETLMKLVDALDEDDDVQVVFSNADIPDDVLEKLNA